MPTHQVFYVVPEDGDLDEAHPNVLLVQGASQQLRLGELRGAFPLPGAYHFRFKRSFRSSAVWLDLLDDEAAVPAFEGVIFAKVSRVSSGAGAGGGGPSASASASAGVASAGGDPFGLREERAPPAGAVPRTASASPPVRADMASTGAVETKTSLFSWEEDSPEPHPPASAPPRTTSSSNLVDWASGAPAPSARPTPPPPSSAAGAPGAADPWGAPAAQPAAAGGGGGGGDDFFDFIGAAGASGAEPSGRGAATGAMEDLSWGGDDPFAAAPAPAPLAAAPGKSAPGAGAAAGGPKRTTSSQLAPGNLAEAAKTFSL